MERQQITSSNISSVGYDSSSMTLEIEFHDGATYQYSNVPQHVCDGIIADESPGRYFHKNIRDKYLVSRVE